MRSRRHLLGFSIRLADLWPGQRDRTKIEDFRDHKRLPLSDDLIRSRVIGTSLLPGSPVASAVTLSTTVAVCNVYRPVHIGLILTDPTGVV
jgi:hypothetical protein